MTLHRSFRSLMSGLFFVLVTVVSATSGEAGAASNTGSPPSVLHDGQHDFDWEIGAWTTHLKRRLHPLTGSNEWVAYEGTTVVRKVWDGRSNLVELDVHGPAGRIEGASWRLYNPDARQWSLNFSNVRGGTLSPPTIGAFKDGRGEFWSADTLEGRAILVRFVISDITRNSAHFEQAFSDDGGRTWETNWIADDARVNPKTGSGLLPSSGQ